LHNYRFRPIEAALRRCILEICAKNLEGSDYLSASLYAWLADNQGRFTTSLFFGGCFAYNLKTKETT